MKMKIATAVLLLLPFLAACGDDASAAGKGPGAIADELLDESGELLESAKRKLAELGESVGAVGRTLQGIDGAEAAEAAKAKLEGLVKSLRESRAAELVGKLDDELSTAVGDVRRSISALRDDPEVEKVIGPVLQELEGLLEE